MNMEESPFMQIQCPNCKAIYRMDKAKIPENGATATCRKCQTKIVIQKPGPPEAEIEEKASEESTPATPNADVNGFVCPKCKAIYRIDKSKIPENGATATCRKCQTKIVIQKPGPPEAETEEKASEESTPATPSADGNGFVCPKCGFKQVHPTRCYRCGFALQGQNTASQNTANQNTVNQHTVNQHTVSQHTVNQHTVNQHTVNQHTVNQNTVSQNTVGQNTAQTSPIGPSPQMAKTNPAEEQQNTNSGEAEIIVKARFLPLMVLLFFVKPRIEIDGQAHKRSWGTHRFKVTPGCHQISVYFPYFFLPRCGENLIVINLTVNETAYIDYHLKIPLIFVKGSIRQIPAQTGFVPFSP